MPIYTVLGPIEANELGWTSMHEHVFIDAGVWHDPEGDEIPVSMENLGALRWNAGASLDNLHLDDPELAVAELRRAAAHGASGVVDLTVTGIGPRIDLLPDVSRRAGLHLMVGCGWYIHDSHPPEVESASPEELSARLLTELRVGIDGSSIKPALIGEIGTGEPITDRERKVLRAAAWAACETGAAVNVHLEPTGARGLEAVELLAGEGVPTSRIVLSHLDEHPDLEYHLAVAETGAIVEYDTFGEEFYWGDLLRMPTDLERFELVAALLERGYEDQLVLGCDVWLKTTLCAFGGMGYEHLFRRVIPALQRLYGVTDDQVRRMLIETPRRLLDRPAPAPSHSGPPALGWRCASAAGGGAGR